MITLYSLGHVPVRFAHPYNNKPVKIIKRGLFSKAQLAKQPNTLIILLYLNEFEFELPTSLNLDYVINYIKNNYSWVSHCHILVGDVPWDGDTIDNLYEFDFYQKVQAALLDVPVTLYHPQNFNGQLPYADSWLYEWLTKFRHANPEEYKFVAPKSKFAHPIAGRFRLDYRGHKYEFNRKLSCLNNRTESERSYLAVLLWNLDCLLTYRDGFINYYPMPKFKDMKILKKYIKLLPTVSNHFNTNEQIEHPDHFAFTIYQSLRLIEEGFCNVIIESAYWSQIPRITEKTCKPIMATRPWIFAGAPGTLAWLRDQGFHTFSRWWDESYDQETDHWRRLEKVYRTAEFVNSLSAGDCADILNQMKPILEHNYLHLTKKFVHRTTANLFK